MTKLYLLLSNLLKPLVFLLVKKRLKSNLEDQNRYRERFGITSALRPENSRVIWFNAASVGESLSVISIIEEWLKKNPLDYIILTTTTVTSAKIIESRKIQRLIHQFAPFDVQIWVKKFITYWQPKILVLVESEIWPSMILESYHKEIPIILLNGKFSEKSFLKWKIFKKFATSIFKKISYIYAQSKESEKNFKYFGVNDIEIAKNLKFFNKALPFDHDEFARLQPIFNQKKCLLLASSHEGEEEIIFNIHKKIKKDIPDLLTIVVPRHTKRVKSIIKLCKNYELKSALRSHQKQDLPKDIYIVDTMNELGLFYRLVKLVIIGGTLVPIGGHNPIEPALLGCAVLWGNYNHNIKEICSCFEKDLSCVNDIKTLEKKIISLLQDFKICNEIGLKMQLTVKNQSIFMNKIIKKIEELI
jgi:3-deoxy-D-manno-octulosonic-acid transferase